MEIGLGIFIALGVIVLIAYRITLRMGIAEAAREQGPVKGKDRVLLVAGLVVLAGLVFWDLST